MVVSSGTHLFSISFFFPFSDFIPNGTGSSLRRCNTFTQPSPFLAHWKSLMWSSATCSKVLIVDHCWRYQHKDAVQNIRTEMPVQSHVTHFILPNAINALNYVLRPLYKLRPWQPPSLSVSCYGSVLLTKVTNNYYNVSVARSFLRKDKRNERRVKRRNHEE